MGDCDGWTVETLQKFYDERLEENQRRSDERYAQIQETMRLDRETMDKRFDSANRYKETYSETLTKISNETLKRIEFDSRMGATQEKIDTLGRTNWPLYSSFGGIAISMIVGLWVIIGLKIDATSQPLVVSLEQAKIANEARDRSISDLRTEFARTNQGNDAGSSQQSRDISTLQQQAEASKVDRTQINDRLRLVESQVLGSQQADANSKTDRAQLNERTTKLEESLSDRKAIEATLRASLVELESQICSGDNIRNLTHASDLRTVNLIWNRLNMGVFPVAPVYFPEVCNKALYQTK